MKLFDLSLQFNGFPIDKAKAVLKAIQNKNDVEFEAYIEAKKQEIVAYHLEHNPFYRTFAKDADPNDWNSIPIINKRHLQQPLNNRLSEGFNKKNVYVNKTSGSSGDPFIFAKDTFCHALTWSVFMDRYNWFDMDFNTSKQARFYGIPLNKKGYYKERLKDFLSHRYRFSVFDLSDTQFEKNLIKFQSTKFHYINGYTSAIVQFAKFLKQKNIVLKSICPSLKACIVTSEMLFKEDRRLLETQFGITIINEYGAAELGLIAFQNPDNEWLVNSDDLFVEIIDDDNNVLSYGEAGRVVITSFYNKAHPFIRYELGDIGMLSEKSTLRKPLLETLIGRTSDIVLLPSGKKAAGLAFYYVTKTVIENNTPVKEFIVEQLKLDTFQITYVSDFELSKEKLKAIKQAIDSYLEPNLQIIFKREDFLVRNERGKLKQFISYL